MTQTLSQNNSNTKWWILVLGTLTNTLVGAAPIMCLPVLFAEISADLNLSLVQLGVIWGISALPGVVTVLIGGAVGDHFGPKRMLIVTSLMVGLTGALRGMANDFNTLAAAVLLFGVFTPFVTLNSFKSAGLWFPSRQLGFASGVLSMGMALGFLLSSMFSATFLSPLLGGWRNVLFFYGAISALMALPWLFVPPPPKSQPESSRIAAARPAEVGELAAAAQTANPSVWRSLADNLGKMARIRSVWLYGMVIFGFQGCVQGALGYLPLYLRGQGWADASADGAAAAFHTVSMLAVIPIALLSDRLRTRKKVLVGSSVMMGLGIGLLSIAVGPVVWVAVILAGMVRDGFMAVFTTAILETEGVGPVYAGTAMGIVFIFSGLGNLIAPPLGNSFASLSPGAPFMFWSALTLVGLAGLLLTNERRARPALTTEA